MGFQSTSKGDDDSVNTISSSEDVVCFSAVTVVAVFDSNRAAGRYSKSTVVVDGSGGPDCDVVIIISWSSAVVVVAGVPDCAAAVAVGRHCSVDVVTF